MFSKARNEPYAVASDDLENGVDVTSRLGTFFDSEAFLDVGGSMIDERFKQPSSVEVWQPGRKRFAE